MTGTEAI